MFEYFSKNLSRKFKFDWNLTKLTGTLHEDDVHLWQYLAQFFLEWEMLQTKVVQKIKTHILCSITFFSSENLDVYEIIWTNSVESDRPQMIIWRMHTTCWILQATDTHSEYVIVNVFSLQQWLRKRATVILCIHCLSCSFIHSFFHSLLLTTVTY